MQDIQNKTSLIIMALNLKSISDEINYIKSAGLDHLKTLRGAYQGAKEISHLIELKTLVDLQRALSLAAEYNQDSILVLDVDRNAELFYIGVGIEPLGRFVNVTEEEALKADAWTHCPILDAYYICR